jgi:hypothetical protein
MRSNQAVGVCFATSVQRACWAWLWLVGLGNVIGSVLSHIKLWQVAYARCDASQLRLARQKISSDSIVNGLWSSVVGWGGSCYGRIMWLYAYSLKLNGCDLHLYRSCRSTATYLIVKHSCTHTQLYTEVAV